MTVHTQILSIITVLDSRHQRCSANLQTLHEAASAIDIPMELVIVCNGLPVEGQAHIRELTEKLDNIQTYILKEPVDSATALLAGLENAIGDWVATIDILSDDPAVVAQLFEKVLTENTEVALGIAKKLTGSSSIADRLLSFLFHRFFKIIHGYSLSEEAPTARLLSRSVVNNILQHDAPLLALETLTASVGYHKSVVATRRSKGIPLSIAERARSRWRVLIGSSTAPLRLANIACGGGALLSLVYSLYVVIVFLLKDDVVPGWTTVSLILSSMFFMMSMVLWLLSEYLVSLLDISARQPRYEIAEEFVSNTQTRKNMLNVETEL